MPTAADLDRFLLAVRAGASLTEAAAAAGLDRRLVRRWLAEARHALPARPGVLTFARRFDEARAAAAEDARHLRRRVAELEARIAELEATLH